jgi:hypothetical protein
MIGKMGTKPSSKSLLDFMECNVHEENTVRRRYTRISSPWQSLNTVCLVEFVFILNGNVAIGPFFIPNSKGSLEAPADAFSKQKLKDLDMTKAPQT